jgi:hypothetical protein
MSSNLDREPDRPLIGRYRKWIACILQHVIHLSLTTGKMSKIGSHNTKTGSAKGRILY